MELISKISPEARNLLCIHKVHMMFLQVYFEKKKKRGGDISIPILVCSGEFFSDT